MHKQDFNHIRQLFAEIFEKDATIKELKSLLFQSARQNADLRDCIAAGAERERNYSSHIVGLRNNNDSLRHSLQVADNFGETLREQLRLANATILRLSDEIKLGPIPSDLEILDIVVGEFGDTILERKIGAIKRARELARGRLGLKEAKDLVEGYLLRTVTEDALKVIRGEYPGLGCGQREWDLSQKEALIDRFRVLTKTSYDQAEQVISGMWEYTQYK